MIVELRAGIARMDLTSGIELCVKAKIMAKAPVWAKAISIGGGLLMLISLMPWTTAEISLTSVVWSLVVWIFVLRRDDSGWSL